MSIPHSFPRAFHPLLLLTWGLLFCACTPKTGPNTQRPRTQSKRVAAKVELPAPLPVPRSVPAQLFLRDPAKVEQQVKVSLEDGWSIRQELREALAAQLSPNDAQRVASVCDISKPWHFLALRGGVELMAAWIEPKRAGAMQSWLSSLPVAGNFGARKLKGKTNTWFIWTGTGQDRVLVAPSLRGLVTAHGLQDSNTDVRAAVISSGLSPARRSQLQWPQEIKELKAAGSLDALSIDLKVDESVSKKLIELPIGPGPIPTLQQDPTVVWSGSGTWTDAQAQVRAALSQVRALVQDLPFLVRPTAQDLEQRLIQSVKQWDGRSALALDQKQSLRIALGVRSTGSSETATLGLIQASIPNLQLMRSFSTQIPSARLVQQRARSNGQKIHELILSDIAGQLPPELHSLLSRRRRLHIAMSWSTKTKSLLLTLGPNAIPSMLSWIQSSHSNDKLFKASNTPELLRARTTMAASILLNWLASEQSLPSLAQLLRMRSATPSQDYAVSLTRPAKDLVHLDVRIKLEQATAR